MKEPPSEALNHILPLGTPELYLPSEPVDPAEITALGPVIQALHEAMMAFRKRYGAGRAIAAPQIGVRKRLIYMHIDQPVIMINPSLHAQSAEMMEVWDDCMCFPELLVKVLRHRRCRVDYTDALGQAQSWALEDDLSELIQHEYDHLDGILATQRAIDAQSFALRAAKPQL